jgi:hypothetical protein
LLQRSLAAMVGRYWPTESGAPVADTAIAYPIEALYETVETLSPHDDEQRAGRDQSLALARAIANRRVLLFGYLDSSIPQPFLMILVFWLCIIFASFALFASRSATAIAGLFVCALSVSSAVFLILELDRPIGGLLQISGAPLQAALAALGR